MVLWASVPGQEGQVFLDGVEGRVVQMAMGDARQYYNSAKATEFYMDKLGVRASELPRKARICEIGLDGPTSSNIAELVPLPLKLGYTERAKEVSA